MKNSLSPVQIALLILGGLALVGVIAWLVLSGGGGLTPQNGATPVPMPGAAPPKPGEKRGPGSHRNLPPGPAGAMQGQ